MTGTEGINQNRKRRTANKCIAGKWGLTEGQSTANGVVLL